MQEIHSTGGGRFFVGAGDRRLRPHHLHNNNNNQNQQALKCPRCDSLNTKFCYYNNYNLSQPRYFCKSCRRYWTKGGVLRNVPVGGGCRKSKRSKTKSSSSSAVNTPPTTTTSPQPETDPKTSNSNSSSESSSLAAEAVSVSAPSSENLPESNLLVHPNSNPNFEPESGIFSEIGNLTSLMSSNNDVALGFEYGNINVSDTSSFQFSASTQGNHHHHHHHNRGLKFAEMSGSLLDQTVPVDLASKGFGPLDWQGSTDHQGLFDLPNTVDQAYWSHTHWNQDTPSTLFHLP